MKSEQGSSANRFFAAAVTDWQSVDVRERTTDALTARELTLSAGTPAALSLRLEDSLATGFLGFSALELSELLEELLFVAEFPPALLLDELPLEEFVFAEFVPAALLEFPPEFPLLLLEFPLPLL